MSEAPNPPTRRSLLGPLVASALIGRLFFRVTLGRRRTLWMALLMLIPILLAIYWRLFEEGSGVDWFVDVTIGVFLQFFTLGLSLYLGVSAVRDEIEDRTIVYLFARPVHRAVILGGKIMAVVAVLVAAMTIDVLLVYLVAASKDGVLALAAGLTQWLLAVLVIVLATLAYTSLFALIGVLIRKPMVVAILVGFGWEVVVSNLPGGLPRATLMYYFKSLLGVGPEGEQLLALLIPRIDPAGFVESLLTGMLAFLIFSTLALYWGSRKEFRV